MEIYAPHWAPLKRSGVYKKGGFDPLTLARALVVGRHPILYGETGKPWVRPALYGAGLGFPEKK